jgi:hypothetical protein
VAGEPERKGESMPVVDPKSHEPLSDDPKGPDALRGGKKIGDPALADAREQGDGHKKHQQHEDGLLLGDEPAP